MVVGMRIKHFADTLKVPVAYKLTHLQPGSSCWVYEYLADIDGPRFVRKTRNEGMNGSTRYISYPDLDSALLAGVAWARRKDEEAAAEKAARKPQ
jgi:hypothetical protein